MWLVSSEVVQDWTLPRFYVDSQHPGQRLTQTSAEVAANVVQRRDRLLGAVYEGAYCRPSSLFH